MEGQRFDDMARAFADGISRRVALRRAGAAVMGAALALAGRTRDGAAACRGADSVCRENANCCSGVCGPKNQTGRRTCTCDAGETLCYDKCCPIGACTFYGCLTEARVTRPTTAEVLWRAVFESDALAPTLSFVGFVPQAGSRFQLRAAPPGKTASLVDCEVVEVEYPTRVVFTWQTESMPAPATAVLTMEETEKGPRLGVNRVGGDPTSCDVATALLGRRWQRSLFAEALPAYLQRMQPE
jgi:uncharacterized protein YndB with AHSA1/START domain